MGARYRTVRISGGLGMAVEQSERASGNLPFLIFLNFAIVLPTPLFQQGPWRLALLAAFAGWIVARKRPGGLGTAVARALERAPWAVRLAVFGTAPVMVLAVSLGSPNKVRIWEAAVIAAMVALLSRRGRPPAWCGRVLVALALTVPLLNLASGMLVPKLSDVATTTVDAVRMVLDGHNPYAAAQLDPLGAVNAHAPGFGGYKYLPVMIAIHLPFVVPFGPMAVLWANALMMAALCAVVCVMVRDRAARLTAIAVLLVAPEMAESSFAMGFNDLPGTLLVLAAFAVWGRWPLAAGLLVGLGVSCKLMPALAAVTILFPPRRWKPYAVGVALGGLPILAFLAWDAQAFLRNIVLFNLVRWPDPTSWRMIAPAWMGKAASLGAVALWLGGSARLAWRAQGGEVPLDARLRLFAIVTLALIMAGATAHDDYMIWWMPALAVLLAREAVRGRDGMGERVVSPAGFEPATY